jgi:hypothetical protein
VRIATCSRSLCDLRLKKGVADVSASSLHGVSYTGAVAVDGAAGF